MGPRNRPCEQCYLNLATQVGLLPAARHSPHGSIGTVGLPEPIK